MKRSYYIIDANGERRAREDDFPLRVGGSMQAGLVLPDVHSQALFAVIAFAEGHAYLQPVDDSGQVYLNDEKLSASAWLKSGDRIEIDNTVISWAVQGEKVFIRVSLMEQAVQPSPPESPVPAVDKPARELPVTEVPVAKRSGKRLRNTLLITFSVLVVVMGFLLFSVPLDIRISPEPDAIDVDGFPPPFTFSQRQLFLPGRYRLLASKKGYQPLDEMIEVGYGEGSIIEFSLLELPGQLQFMPEPDVPIHLFVDGEPYRFSGPGMAEITRGVHQLRIETQRYLPVEQSFTVSGRGQKQILEFQLQPAWATVLIDSQPEGAMVSVDGDELGSTPLQLDILHGKREIELALPGFKPVRIARQFEAGNRVVLDRFELQPADGELVLNSTPTGGTVTIDDRFYGTTPVSIELSSGTEHTIRVSKAGYHTHKSTVSLQADQTRELEIALQAEYGTVFIATTPADAELFLDGKPLDSSRHRLRLTARGHSLKVTKKGYVSKTVSLTPRSGVTETVKVTLERAQQQGKTVRPSSVPPATLETSSGQLLRLVPATPEFTMGASRREAGRRANESRRKIQLTRPFYFGEKEVSNGQFRKFRSGHNSAQLDGASLNDNDQPVVNVSWDDAARYCNWLSKQDGLPAAYEEVDGHMVLQRPVNTGYRLPTEAEWAYVARALGKKKPARYAWSGNYPPTRVSGNYADARIADTLADTVPAYNDGYRGTAPVGTFGQWPPGFYDLGGNVAEWTGDYYGVYPGEETVLVRDPVGPANGEHRVVRGAGWRHGNITELRLSYRDYSKKPRYDLGFRIARYAN